MKLFIQRVCGRLCNLNNNGVFHTETICAAAECPSFPLVPKGYTSNNVKLLCIVLPGFESCTRYLWNADEDFLSLFLRTNIMCQAKFFMSSDRITASCQSDNIIVSRNINT